MLSSNETAVSLYVPPVDPTNFENGTWGRAVRTPGLHGYVAFVPERLPRALPLAEDVQLLLSEADIAVGRLAGAGRLLRDPGILVRPYSAREAVDSSRIEGTQASLSDVFASQATHDVFDLDLREVLNYLEALDHGLARLRAGFPLSVRLLREMHERLLTGVRGQERTPGDLRTTQNWIGPAGATIETATFVPPPPEEMIECLRDWEAFPHETVSMPVLVQCAVLHYQFETIHPFVDGNGRLGRLFVILLLVEREILPGPLLYVSTYLERHRDEYYARLQAVRERGEMTEWLAFFLRAVRVQAEDALSRAERLMDLRERYRSEMTRRTRSRATQVVDLLFSNPIISAGLVQRSLGVTNQGALNLIRHVEAAGLIEPYRPTRSNRPARSLQWVAPEVIEAVQGGLTL
jgi:Fic family protein